MGICRSAHGTPATEQVFAFVGGVLAAMAVTVLASFRRPASTQTKNEPPRRAYAAVHLVSVFVAVSSGWAVARTLSGIVAFFLAPLCAISLFHVLVAVEITLAAVDE